MGGHLPGGNYVVVFDGVAVCSPGRRRKKKAWHVQSSTAE